MLDAPFPESMVEDIERFLTKVHPNLEPGRDIYPEVFQTNLFFPLQRQRELAAMIRIARRVGAEEVNQITFQDGSQLQWKDQSPPVDLQLHPKPERVLAGGPTTVMEIGADKGGGLYHWCQCLPTVKNVIACEIRGLPYAAAFERAFPHIDFLWLPESSHEGHASRTVNWWLSNTPIDVLFLDGDKNKFQMDFDTYRGLMRPGSVAFFHDIQDRSPMIDFEVVIRRGYPNKRIVDVSEAQEALDREERGIPPFCPHEAWLRHWKGKSCGVGVVYIDR